jgi:hypothetical protein
MELFVELTYTSLGPHPVFGVRTGDTKQWSVPRRQNVANVLKLTTWQTTNAHTAVTV